jgi:hypothetical protein
MDKPTIFLANFHPFITRNIIESGVLELLTKKAKVVMLVPSNKADYFQANFASDDVIICGVDLDEAIRSKANSRFSRIAELLIDTRVKHYHKLILLKKTGKKAKYYLTSLITKTASHIYPLKWFLRWVDLRLNNPMAFKAEFAKYKPDLVFSTDPFSDADVLLLKTAKALKVKDVAMIRSWDNATTKTYLRVVPSSLVVQNEQMKLEMHQLHDYPFDKIKLCGIPQFEWYLNYQPAPREVLCDNMGIDPAKKILLYCPASELFIDTDWQICETIKQLIEEKAIPEDIHVIVRLHPYNFTDLSKLKPDSHFTIENPNAINLTERVKDRELNDTFREHIADEIYHSNIVINVVSSVMFDSAVYDKPTITIGFNGFESKVEYIRSVERMHNEEYLTDMLSDGGAPVVKSKAELAAMINRYLADPSADSDLRQKSLQRQAWKFDGQSKERIADYVLTALTD